VLAGILYLMISLLVRTKRYYYGILLTPAFDLLTAGILMRWIQSPTRHGVVHPAVPMKLRLVFMAAAAIPLTIGSVQSQLLLLKQDSMVEHVRVIASIQSHIRPDSTVMGSQTYWFGLNTNSYLSWEQIVYRSRAYHEATVSESLLALAPDYLIFDDHFRSSIVESRDESNPDPYATHLTLLQGDVQEALDKGYHRVGVVESQQYGLVEIFERIR